MLSTQVKLQLVHDHQRGESVSGLARGYGLTRKTVAKWLRRYERFGERGLQNISRVPKSDLSKIPKDLKREIINFRKAEPKRGYSHLVAFLLKSGYTWEQIPSKKTCYYHWRKQGLVIQRTSRKLRGQDLRRWKSDYFAFEQGEVIVRNLGEIENFTNQASRVGGCPQFLFTYQDVKTGAKLMALASDDSLLYLNLFVLLVHSYLRKSEVSPRRYYSARGREFLAAKPPLNNSRLVDYMKRCLQELNQNQKFELTKRSQAPGSEFQFWSGVGFGSADELLRRLKEYQDNYNLGHKSKFRGGQTPLQIAKQDKITKALGLLITKDLFVNFPVLVLDRLEDDYLKLMS